MGFVSRGSLFRRTLTRILNRKPGRDNEHLSEGVIFACREQHPGELRIHRKLGQRAPDLRETSPVIHAVQFGENRVAIRNRAGRRRLHKGKILHIAETEGLHAQNDRCEVASHDFRIGIGWPAGKIRFAVKPDADTVRHTAASAASLIGRRLGNRFNQKLLHLIAVGVTLHAGKPGVNHIADSGHRDRGFRHIGRENDTAFPAALKHPLLLLCRKPRVKREDVDAVLGIIFPQRLRSLTDFPLTRQEDENVAAACHFELIHSVRNRPHERLVVV